MCCCCLAVDPFIITYTKANGVLGIHDIRSKLFEEADVGWGSGLNTSTFWKEGTFLLGYGNKQMAIFNAKMFVWLHST